MSSSFEIFPDSHIFSRIIKRWKIKFQEWGVFLYRGLYVKVSNSSYTSSKTYLRLQSISRHFANPYVFKELSNRVGTDADLHIGPAIKLASIQDKSYPEQITFLRQRLYGLGHEYFNALERKSDNTDLATQLLGQSS